jgi:hypothetical protein
MMRLAKLCKCIIPKQNLREKDCFLKGGEYNTYLFHGEEAICKPGKMVAFFDPNRRLVPQ